MGKAYTYRIDLDERGLFRAHVENTRGRAVFTLEYPSYSCRQCELGPRDCKCANVDDPDICHPDDQLDSRFQVDSTIFEDGFMRDKNDIPGLERYLWDLGIMPRSLYLLGG